MKKLIILLFVILSIVTACSNKKEETATIKESFLITSIDQEGYVNGTLTNGNGEGIYYHMDELTAYDVTINEGDTITIEWTEDNYNNGDWDVIESVTLK